MPGALRDRIDRWGRGRPSPIASLARDAAALAEWHAAAVWLDELASPAAADARASWRAHVRHATAELARRHVDELDAVVATPDAAGAVDDLAAALPGLVAGDEELAADGARPLASKIGVEYRAAVVLSELLAAPRPGRRLLRGSRWPLRRSLELLAAFQREGAVELPGARVRRSGAAAVVELVSPESLNAESDPVLDSLETCVDLALLDPGVEVGVLRGAAVQHRKYAGRRVFCSGLNLTELYRGRLSYLYYIRRELGLVSKLQCGLTVDGDQEIEKPWIAAVDAHAIGGGCQLLLVADLVIAEQGSLLGLPARREGIIPGAANLRLPRLVGERTARRMILTGHSLIAGSAEADCLVDQVVPPDRMDASIDAAVEDLTSSGTVSLASNRKALRLGQEPEELFRAYMAHFALAQADCHFGAGLIRNLERHWIGRRGDTEAEVAR